MWSRPRARTAAAPPSRRWERGWAGSESTATCTWTRRRSPYAPIGRPRCALHARRHALPGPETILTSVRVSGQPSRSPRRASGLQNDIHQTLASATGANDLSQLSARPAAPAHAPPHTRRFFCPLVWALPSPFRLSSGSRLTVHRILRRPDGADALPRALVPCVLTGLLQAELSLRLALHLAARLPQPLEGRLAGSDGHVLAAILAFHLRLRITVTPPTTPSTHPHFEENKAASGCLRARPMSQPDGGAARCCAGRAPLCVRLRHRQAQGGSRHCPRPRCLQRSPPAPLDPPTEAVRPPYPYLFLHLALLLPKLGTAVG